MSQKPVHETWPDPIDANENSNPSAATGEAASRAIFRTQAVEQHMRNQERTVFPSLVSPRSFTFLWILAFALLAVGLLIAFWPILSPILDSILDGVP